MINFIVVDDNEKHRNENVKFIYTKLINKKSSKVGYFAIPSIKGINSVDQITKAPSDEFKIKN